MLTRNELDNELGEWAVYDLKEKLGSYFNLVKTFIIEENYVDREWREEFSLFYSTTFYKDVNKFAVRVHLLGTEITDIDEIKNIRQEDYIGYVVLRPYPVPRRILKVFVKPIKELFGVKEDEDLYMCTCEFKPHVGGKEFRLETFPFYSQDSMVTVCAHACMWMVTMYLHKKYGMNRPYLKDFIAQTPPYYGRILPAEALYIDQIVYSLVNNGYFTSLKAFTPNEAEKCINRVDSYLESGLPTILLFDNHAIVVAGHTFDSEGNRDWIIFDDSGHHLEEFARTKQFAYRVEKEKIQNRIEEEHFAAIIGRAIEEFKVEVTRDRTPSIYTVNIEFERMYYPVESVYECLRVLQRALQEKSDINLSEKQSRILLVNSKKLKELYCCNDVAVFEDVDLPHYVWLIELYEENKVVTEIIVDASTHKYDFRFGLSIIAIWNRDSIKIYKDGLGKVINVGKYPIQFSNLTKIVEVKK